MFRFPIVPLLIVGLLACPLRCAAGAGSLRPDARASAGGCACCDSGAAEAMGSPEQRPDGECSCSHCICHGAVVPYDADLLPAAVEDGWRHSIPSWDTALSLRLVRTCPPDRFSSGGYLCDGRAARIAHQSLLI